MICCPMLLSQLPLKSVASTAFLVRNQILTGTILLRIQFQSASHRHVLSQRRRLYHLSFNRQLLEPSLVAPVPRIPARASVLDSRSTSTNPFSWNAALLRAHLDAGAPLAAVAVFKEMLQKGAKPNGITFSFAVRAFSGVGDLKVIMGIHGQLLMLGFHADVFALNTLVGSYVACGPIDFARGVFDEMPNRDLVSWTVMMNGYVRRNRSRDAVDLFHAMVAGNVRPDGKAVVAVITACAQLGDLTLARKLRSLVLEEEEEVLWRDVYVMNALIDMYAKCGCIDDAQSLFDSVVDKDIVTWNSLVSGYARSRNMASARKVFDRIPEKNEVSWSALISGHVENAEYVEALNVYCEMRTMQVVPNNAALTCAIAACAHLGALDLGREIHSSLKENMVRSDVLRTALVDMYAKCGCLEMACALFDRIDQKTVVSWNVMIMGMAIHGNAPACFRLFSGLLQQGLRPNSDTFVGLLSGCAHAGWLREGKDCFIGMTSVYGIRPQLEHCSCMVHLMGQAGHVDQAFEFIRSCLVTPDVALWGALLSACNAHGNVRLGEFAAKRILELEPSHTGAYVQLSGIYAKAGLWKEAMDIRMVMKERGIRNRPGESSFEADGAIHEFVVGDDSHPQIEEILSVLFTLDCLLASNHWE